MIKSLGLTLLMCSISGCALQDAHTASTAKRSLIGLRLGCAKREGNPSPEAEGRTR
jgi:hypothetical protein